jgi:alpha-glucan,water dikinase
VGHSGPRAAALIAPLLQNLALSLGDNEEVCYCLKAWQELPHSVRFGEGFGKDDALRVSQHLSEGRRMDGM